MTFFCLTLPFAFSSLSCDRSFTPTHPSYYSPKHESMMEEMLSCQQVRHGAQHTDQSGGSRTFIFFFWCVLPHWKFNGNSILRYTAWFFFILSRCRHFPGRMRGTRIVLAGAQRTWITWLYPPAPFTLGTCIHPGISYTQQDIVMNEYERSTYLFPDKYFLFWTQQEGTWTFHIILIIQFGIYATSEVLQK